MATMDSVAPAGPSPEATPDWFIAGPDLSSVGEPSASRQVGGAQGAQPLLLRNVRCLTHVEVREGAKGHVANPHGAGALWDAGCQLLGLSATRFDAPLQLLHGKFLDNGGCGYVLKPKRMRAHAEALRHPAHTPPRKLHKLQIKLLCGQHLPKAGQRRVEKEAWHTNGCPLLRPHELSPAAVVSPYVVVEAVGGAFAAAGDDLDECSHGDAWVSRTVAHNGLAPQWMQTVEVGVADPDLAVVRVTVWDGPATPELPPKFLCYAALPFAALRAGYRNVPMRDKDGCKVAFCKLLWHVRRSHTHLPPHLKSLADDERAERLAERHSHHHHHAHHRHHHPHRGEQQPPPPPPPQPQHAADGA